MKKERRDVEGYEDAEHEVFAQQLQLAAPDHTEAASL
jgi:hypothetical protein